MHNEHTQFIINNICLVSNAITVGCNEQTAAAKCRVYPTTPTLSQWVYTQQAPPVERHYSVTLQIEIFTVYLVEARFRPNIGLTLRGDLAVFMCSAITPPKINRFG